MIISIDHIPAHVERTWPELFNLILVAQQWDTARRQSTMDDLLADSICRLVDSFPGVPLGDRSPPA